MSILDNHTRDAFQHDGLNFGVATRKPTGFLDNIESAWDHDQTIYRINRENQLKMELVQEDIERYEQLTGETLQVKDRLQPSGDGVVQTEDFFSALTQSPVQALEESLMERLEARPDLMAQFELEYERRVTERMKESVESHKAVSSAATTMGKVGSVAGSLASGMWDPYILGASVVGGGVVGSGVSLGRGILLETIVGSAVETLAQPSIAKQSERAGEEYGWDDAVTNVVLSGVLSGGLYGSVRGSGQVAKVLRDRASGVDRDTRIVLDYLANRLDEGIDSPFTVGSRMDALEHFNRIDEATNSLMQGRMIQPQHVDVSQVSFNIIRGMDQQAQKLARLVRDPDMRRMFEESWGEQREMFTAELEQLDKDVLEAAGSAEAGVASRRMGEAEGAEKSLQSQLTDVDRLRGGLDEGEPDVAGLARFAPDEITEERLLAIARDLEQAGLSKKNRARLEAERDSILETVMPDLQRNIAAEQRELEEQLKVKQSKRSMAANNVRQTAAYKAERRERERKLTERVAALTARIEGGQPADNPLQISYDMTPYRSMVRDTRVAAQDAVETAIKLESALPRVKPKPEKQAEIPEPKPENKFGIEARASDEKTLLIEPADKRSFLSAKITPDAVVLKGVAVDKKRKGEGIGTALYEAAIAEAAKRGLPFRSDTTVSEAAVRVYDSLKRKGYEVRRNEGVVVEKGSGVHAFDSPGKYAFEVRPKRQETPDVQQPPLYQTLAETPDRPLSLADPVTGGERLISARDVLDELDEDANFIQAFKECRSG